MPPNPPQSEGLAVKWLSTSPQISKNVAEVIYNFDESKTFKQSGFDFEFAIQNNTGRDITIPAEVSIMKRIADGGVLADYSLVAKLRNPVFLPAKQRAQLTVSMGSAAPRWTRTA